MNKYVYGISARIECLDGDLVSRTNPKTKILLGRRLKIGWWLMRLGMKIAAGEDYVMNEEIQEEHVFKDCKWHSDDNTDETGVMEMKPFGRVFIPRTDKNDIKIDEKPIVLCEDCKQWDEEGSYMGRGWCGWHMKSTGPWFFCADGEKEDADGN